MKWAGSDILKQGKKFIKTFYGRRLRTWRAFFLLKELGEHYIDVLSI
jgi:hypothetical protein